MSSSFRQQNMDQGQEAAETQPEYEEGNILQWKKQSFTIFLIKQSGL